MENGIPIFPRARHPTGLHESGDDWAIGSPLLAKFARQRYQQIMHRTRLSLIVRVGFLRLGILQAGIFLAMVAPRASRASDPLVDVTRKIAAEVTANGKAYANLRELTTIGPRLSGSEGAAKAVEWAKRKMESNGFEHVTLQPAMVPHWTRGDVERATVISTLHPTSLKVTALGPSVGTPQEGVQAGVVEVHSLDEVEKLGPAVRGKIVFYNRPMGTGGKNSFGSYGRTVDQRSRGAAVAAKQGAVAALVRSMTNLPDDDSPHTGMMRYEKDVPMIPAAALSTHSANELSALLKSDPKLTVNLKLSAAQHPPVPSFNVIGELTGRDLPQEYVVVGGHLDSWDLGTGAHDDGTGVVQSIEVLRTLKTLGLRPRRTVRAVLFMAEEFGGVGAKEYANQVRAKGERHVAAIESDSGGFAPVGFGVSGSDQQVAAVKRFAPYLGLVRAGSIEKGSGGTDIAPLGPLGAVTVGYIPVSTHYFDFHHSARDRIEAVDLEELHAGAAAMATLAYLLAEKGL
jgi:carboxypeptidase Q